MPDDFPNERDTVVAPGAGSEDPDNAAPTAPTTQPDLGGAPDDDSNEGVTPNAPPAGSGGSSADAGAPEADAGP
jgi:hypothetical protein